LLLDAPAPRSQAKRLAKYHQNFFECSISYLSSPHPPTLLLNSGFISMKRFGKTDVQISALGLGGHHLGSATDEQTAVEILHRSFYGGITYFDCCWDYNRGKSEDWFGKGLKGRREHLPDNQGLRPWPRRGAGDSDAQRKSAPLANGPHRFVADSRTQPKHCPTR
jgi:hypothetical protein